MLSTTANVLWAPVNQWRRSVPTAHVQSRMLLNAQPAQRASPVLKPDDVMLQPLGARWVNPVASACPSKFSDHSTCSFSAGAEFCWRASASDAVVAECFTAPGAGLGSAFAETGAAATMAAARATVREAPRAEGRRDMRDSC